MKNRRNYYRILHVGREAPAAVIQSSYRTLMTRLRLHPDLGGNHVQAALVNEAYATLSDPKRRAEYDQTLSKLTEQRRDGRPTPPPPSATRPAAAASPAASAEQRGSRPSAGPGSAAATVACIFCGEPIAIAVPADGDCGSCRAPLTRVTLGKTAQAVRRGVERVPRALKVSFRSAASPHTPRSAVATDVSLTGMRLRTNARISIGDRLALDCTFCAAVAVVKRASIHRNDDRLGASLYGVEFLTLRIKQPRGGLFSARA
jgi:hypothetical protein